MNKQIEAMIQEDIYDSIMEFVKDSKISFVRLQTVAEYLSVRNGHSVTENYLIDHVIKMRLEHSKNGLFPLAVKCLSDNNILFFDKKWTGKRLREYLAD